MLPSEGDRTHPSFPEGHFLLPDTNIFLSQVRVVYLYGMTSFDFLRWIYWSRHCLHLPSFFSRPCLKKCDIVRCRFIIASKRFRNQTRKECGSFIMNIDRACLLYIFLETISQSCRETAIVREENETPNDRNDRGIRKSVSWYTSHLSQSRTRGRQIKPPTVVLLTEDAANRQKAQAQGIVAMSGEGSYKYFGILVLTFDRSAPVRKSDEGTATPRLTLHCSGTS
jgi:exosome complex exonuclease DIS3/RRP44